MKNASIKSKIIFGLYFLAGVILLIMSGMFFTVLLIMPNSQVLFVALVIGMIILGMFSFVLAFRFLVRNK